MSDNDLGKQSNPDDAELYRKRLYWHCRRGMKELDVLLIPFVEYAFEHLNPVEQSYFELLLSCEDTDMFAWFMRREEPADPRLKTIVDLILNTPPPSHYTCA